MHPRFSNLVLATTALIALGAAPAAGGPEGGTVVGGAATIQGQGGPAVIVNQSSQQRDHQLEHVQYPRQRERALQSAQRLVGRAQPRDRRPRAVGDHGHADRQRPRLHHQPRRHPVRARQRGEHRGLPRHHQRHQERRLHGGALQFQHPGPAGCLDRQSGERSRRRAAALPRWSRPACATPGPSPRRSARSRWHPATASRSTCTATS